MNFYFFIKTIKSTRIQRTDFGERIALLTQTQFVWEWILTVIFPLGSVVLVPQVALAQKVYILLLTYFLIRDLFKILFH